MEVNADPLELRKFSDLAHRWWDPESEFKPLHDINPLRLDYIDRSVGLRGKRTLDVGCGGGILSESMAARGAEVTGIDLSDKALGVARLHLFESGQKVDYLNASAEDFAASDPAAFDVVTCLEMLEHVPDPASIVRACSALLKPGGTAFFSTINRNPKAYLLAVIGAEYLLRLLPMGTHDYSKFIRPAELMRFCRDAGLEQNDIIGMHYNPVTRAYTLGRNTDVNFLVRAVRV
ncbi:MAG: bifunctional 2-polyprenyl-6-hydroxyphenol methylase/3-demethylubiquinol 3-O-methyltransferase UbiG [Sterolibacteriaceae bacterium]|nr:bifunctional 2-polyprenyl-6-hydroxyphenol methylase/3-demethylubiquinol 3-O-methyltransferase UbiG [Candidatus Methylophosphatis haderslevensis]